MGSKSRSQSSQATTNNSTSLGVQGDNTGFMTVGNGNNYNITQTDHGLVDGLVSVWGDMAGNQSDMISAVGGMARDNADMVQGVASDAFNYGENVNRDSLDFASGALGDAFGFGSDALEMTGNLARDSINAQNFLAETAVKENSDLARGVSELAESMHGNNTAFANNALLTTVDAVSGANKGMADLAYYSIDKNSNLATDLAAGAVDKVSDAYKDASDQTILAHKQALQFADSSMRSDGQQLAISTNETMKYIVIGLGGVAIMAVVFMGKK